MKSSHAVQASKISTSSSVRRVSASLADLARIERDLGLTEVQPETIRIAAKSVAHVPFTAIQRARDAAVAHPERLRDFDVAAADEALAFEREMAPLMKRAESMGHRLRLAIAVKRAGAAGQTLGAYATLKALSRITRDAEVHAAAAELGELVTPARTRRAIKAGMKAVAEKKAAEAAAKTQVKPE